MFAWVDMLLASQQFTRAMHGIENALEWFPVDDGLLQAALAVRQRVGAYRVQTDEDARGTISVCMIVKDEEANIVRALRRISPIASEIVVVDTGSSDRTRALATALGARVFEHDWKQDFAAARNAALAQAEGDWILVIDADEVIAAADLPRLLETVRDAGATVGFAMTTRNHTLDPNLTGFVAHDGRYPTEQSGAAGTRAARCACSTTIRASASRVRSTRSSTMRSRATGLTIRDLDVPVHHDGPLARERSRTKAATYHAIAREKLRAAPDDARALHECAIQAGVAGCHDEAIALGAATRRASRRARSGAGVDEPRALAARDASVRGRGGCRARSTRPQPAHACGALQPRARRAVSGSLGRGPRRLRSDARG
jgi:hypothetical protein